MEVSCVGNFRCKLPLCGVQCTLGHYRSKQFNTALLPTIPPVCCLTGMRRLEAFPPSSLKEEIVLP